MASLGVVVGREVHLTEKNRNAANALLVSVDEVTGELIVGEQQIMEVITKQDFSETEDNEFDLMSGYKKCYQGRKKTISKKWSKFETELFYKALTAVGQDFQMIRAAA